MFFALEPIPPASEIVIITAVAHNKRKDAPTQGVEVIDRDHALIHSLGGGIGETISGHAGVRSTFYGPSASRPIIRGLGEDRIRLLTNAIQGVDTSSISPDHAVAIDGLEAQSIEIIKGPAALRFGANAIGGIVNVVDGRLPNEMPKREISGDFFAGAGTNDKSSALSGRIAIKKGDFLWQIDGLNRVSSDYKIPGFVQSQIMRDLSGDDAKYNVFNSRGKTNAFSGGVSLIKENYNLGIALRKQDSQYGIPNEEAFIKLEQSRADFAGALKNDGFINEFSFAASIGDYSHSEIEFGGEIGTIFNVDGYEARLEARHKKTYGFEGLMGMQFAKKDFEAIGDEAFILPVSNDNKGIFIVENFEAEKWGAEFGGRIENTEYSGIAGNRDFSSQSGSLNLYYRPFLGLKLGFIFGVTERTPTETELFANGPHAATKSFEIGDTNLVTEIAKSLEFAIRYKGQVSEIEFNIWRADFDNFIAFTNTGEVEDDLPIYKAIQKDAEITGFEFQASNEFGTIGNAKIKGDFAIDYVKGEYVSGGNIARMPPLSYIIGIEAALNELKTRAELQYLADQNELAEFETKTDTATIINLSMNYSPKSLSHLDIRLMVNNLTNQEIREHSSVLKDLLPKPGRSIRFGIHYKF